MSRLQVERFGGIAGIGLPGAHVKSKGLLDLSALSAADQEAIRRLFAAPPAESAGARDQFRYRLTEQAASAARVVEVAEEHVPEAVRSCVRDVLE